MPTPPPESEVLTYFDTLSNWGRWGDADQLGRLNLVTAAKRRAAAALVTDAYPESIALRLSMTGATIGDVWDLRCAVREYMLQWLRETMPEALIRHRLEVEAANARAKAG